MKAISGLILGVILLTAGGGVIHRAAAQDSLISLTVNNQPLGEVLEAIASSSGYQFTLNQQWQDYPVSATINNLPLEQGLKRLLRNLNHTLIWESDREVTIMIYGKVAGAGSGPATSFSPPVQMDDQEMAPLDQAQDPSSDPVDSANQPVDDGGAAGTVPDESASESGGSGSTLPGGDSDQPSDEPVQQ
jgi:hypothetical protein